MKIYEVVKRIRGVFLSTPKNTPTKGVPDGPLIGNGDMGAVWGIHQNELTCWIGKNDMWSAKPHQCGGGVKSLAVMSLASNALSKGTFRAQQHLAEAYIEIEWAHNGNNLRIRCYAPYKQSLLITRVSCISGQADLRLNLSTLEDPDAKRIRTAWENNIIIEKHYANDSMEWTTSAVAGLRVYEWSDIAGVLSAGEYVDIVLAAYTNHDTTAYRVAVQKALDQINEKKLDEYWQQHLSWWTDFWNQSAIYLDDMEQIMEYWYGSHYIMACCSKKGSFAPGLFGNFITTDQPNWGGDYHLNYNYQAPWWGSYSSNHIELTEPYDVPIIDYIPQAKQNARTLLNCRGVYSVVGIGPFGLEASAMFRSDGSPDRATPFWGQKSNAAYAAMNMLMRFYSTYDMDYARKYAYPYLKEVVAFWEDYLCWEDDRYVVYNDSIHENAFLARFIWDFGDNIPTDYSTDMNSLVTLGLLRAVFKGIIDISDYIGQDKEQQKRWKHILEHLSCFPLQERNGHTVFRYTEKGMDWCSSNSLGIQHVFPAGAIGLSSDETLLEIARNTLIELDRWDDYNAFPTFFTAAVHLGIDAETILDKMNNEINKHGFSNYFIYYGGGGIECCSAVPSCINSMLLQSHEGMIRLFPVWNKRRNASFHNLRSYGAFLVCADLRDGQIENIMLHSEKGRICTILSPWESGMRVISAQNEVKTTYEESSWGKIYRFETTAGSDYEILQKA
ncbi:MAG: glycosyl hydrolase family 95 catalytic domain-containing protein [Christensenellales bacterium]|jgi:alpha-L-fucosidase 2